MKDNLRSTQSRPFITTFWLHRFSALALSSFLRKWLFAAAALAFAPAGNAGGIIAHDAVEKWTAFDAYLSYAPNPRSSCLRDSTEEACQCLIDRDAAANPDSRHIFLGFTRDPAVDFWDGKPSGYCQRRAESIFNSAVLSTVPVKIAQIDYCPQGGTLYGRKNGTKGCFFPVNSTFSLSLTRVPSSQPEKKDDKVLFVVRVKGPDDVPIVNQDVGLKLSQPGKLNYADGSLPIDRVSTDENGEALVEYTPDKKTEKTQIITATCNPSTACLAPAELRIGPTPVIGFFNGVWNTRDQASKGLDALQELIGPTYKGAELQYENFYNQTGTGNGNTMLQDIAEVFIQRQKELDGVLSNRWEHYWELLAGKHAEGDSLTSRLPNGLGNGASALAGLFDATFNAMLGQMFSGYSQMLSNPPTAADVAGQLQKLRGLADEDHSFVLIAHSQGNLFVNTAYDGLRSSHPDTKAAVVHVAPASPTSRGEHLLADIDLVINGLRVQGINTVDSNNISLPTSKSDLSGHTLVGTYLDAARAAREKVNSMVRAVLGAL